MILKRKIYNKLLAWKEECNGSKAILIEGARRIGKSTIAEEFAKNEYSSYLLIDFSKGDIEVENYFVRYLNDLDTFFMLLSTHFGIHLESRKSLIIFDEVQMFPRARAAIKYLVEDGRYDYIETGSLISIKENVKNIVLPSEERHIKMYPLDFEEYLWAMGEDMLIDYIKECFDKKIELERSIHNKAMLLFKQYMLVGGMPKPLIAFIENHKDFVKCDKEKSYGARPLRRFIINRIETPITYLLIDKKVNSGQILQITVKDDNLDISVIDKPNDESVHLIK